MARARNIKPGLYKNEDLAECSIWARYIFPGLWMLADREGRLEDRPKRIKGELIPFDNVEVVSLLDELEQFGFIKRYKVAGKAFITITKFLAHQAPHGTEKDSEIPSEDGYLTVNERGKSGCVTGKFELIEYVTTLDNVKEPDSSSSTNVNPPLDNVNPRNVNALIPDSGFLIPDSLKNSSASQDEKKPGSTPKPSSKGSRLPADWKLPKAWGDWAMAEKGLTEDQVRNESEKFADFWRAKPGKDAIKLDWLATWRNWVRNASERIPAKVGQSSGAALFQGML